MEASWSEQAIVVHVLQSNTSRLQIKIAVFDILYLRTLANFSRQLKRLLNLLVTTIRGSNVKYSILSHFFLIKFIIL